MVTVWSLFVILVTGFIIWQTDQNTLALAKAQAQSAFEKDVLYRRWNAIQGGVYVLESDKTSPNPYLKVPEREVVTPTKRTLTLINPAYMTRLVHELGYTKSGVLGHITSLNPIRPQNAPDPWERIALDRFENGEKQVSSRESIDGQPYLRFMQPLITETGCLKCHAQQGYTVGSVRGGISIAVPMAPLWAITRTYKLEKITHHIT